MMKKLTDYKGDFYFDDYLHHTKSMKIDFNVLREAIIREVESRRHEPNPLIELIKHAVLMCFDTRDRKCYWKYYVEADERAYMASVNLTHEFSSYDITCGQITISFQGFNYGMCLAGSLSARTQKFLSVLSQLGHWDGNMFSIKASYVRTNPDILHIREINSSCGPFSLVGCYGMRYQTKMYDYVDHAGIKITNTPNAENKKSHYYLVCNTQEVMYHRVVEKELKELILGEIPTQEERLMIEMAGYKGEFFLDSLVDFDNIGIKPFNMQEAYEWHNRSLSPVTCKI